ncbi:MAG: J domain-containing protein, partial [Oscillospiraceae bacterium]|nr:J domain-containing protein [Oscillospiraceae bacterium]
MDDIWSILGLDPTQDISAIKRAYALKSRTCHPEEDPEGFLRLRQAYQAALDYAEGRGNASPEAEGPSNDPGAGEPEDEGWSLTEKPPLWDEGPNPYADHPAAKTFLELYTGKQRKNPQAWMNYLTSGEFLDVAWERRY